MINCKYYAQTQCVEFNNGLMVYLGNPEDGSLPFPFLGRSDDTARIDINEQPVDLPEAKRHRLNIVLDWLGATYIDHDAWDSATDELLEQIVGENNSTS